MAENASGEFVRINMEFHRKSPLYHQIYDSLVEQIISGTLPYGTKMPGKRVLAAQLGVAVNTVDSAYQMLTAEGYLIAKPKSGFYVQKVEHCVPVGKNIWQPTLEKDKTAPYTDLSTGATDTALFPFRTWGRIQKELLYEAPELLSYGPRQGEYELRREICNYLTAYRGASCSPEQIVIGAGMEFLLSQLAILLRGGRGAVEDPGYPTMASVLEQGGVPCFFVPVDEGGMNIAALRKCGANICCVTPSHHFPTGVTMGASRRSELLSWVTERKGRYIMEDDYDAEFRYDMRPIPSLQGMANNSVVYLFTFSKSLAPGIRIACMVLPEELLLTYKKTFGGYANTVSRFEQQTLYRFMKGGHFVRHIARMRNTCKDRMLAITSALKAQFGDRIILHSCHTGLHILVTLLNGPGESAMVLRAKEAGYLLHGLGEYYHGTYKDKNTVLISFGALHKDNAEEVAARLASAWAEKKIL